MAALTMRVRVGVVATVLNNDSDGGGGGWR